MICNEMKNFSQKLLVGNGKSSTFAPAFGRNEGVERRGDEGASSLKV